PTASFKCYLPNLWLNHAPTGRSPWNRDGFDSLHRGCVAADRVGFSADSRLQPKARGRTWAAGNGMPVVRFAGGNRVYQLLRGTAPAHLAARGTRGIGRNGGDRPVELLSEVLIRARMGEFECGSRRLVPTARWNARGHPQGKPRAPRRRPIVRMSQRRSRRERHASRVDLPCTLLYGSKPWDSLVGNR